VELSNIVLVCCTCSQASEVCALPVAVNCICLINFLSMSLVTKKHFEGDDQYFAEAMGLNDNSDTLLRSLRHAEVITQDRKLEFGSGCSCALVIANLLEDHKLVTPKMVVRYGQPEGGADVFAPNSIVNPQSSTGIFHCRRRMTVEGCGGAISYSVVDSSGHTKMFFIVGWSVPWSMVNEPSTWTRIDFTRDSVEEVANLVYHRPGLKGDDVVKSDDSNPRAIGALVKGERSYHIRNGKTTLHIAAAIGKY